MKNQNYWNEPGKKEEETKEEPDYTPFVYQKRSMVVIY